MSVVILCSFCNSFSVAEENSIIYVDDDGNADYTTIQEAIKEAENGDTIYVYPGMYYGEITIEKTLTLTGEDKTKTIIDGQQHGEDTITVTAPNVHIRGFTITNGPQGFGYNSGIKLEDADNSVLENLIFTDNCWAAEIRSSSHCIFTDNQVIDNTQGGVHLVFANTATISHNLFSGNERRGLCISKGNNQIITSNTFVNCGIDIGAQPPPGNTIHCTITDNTVNGKPLVYLENETGKIIRDAGQVILNQCNGIIISRVDVSNTSTGISIYKSNFITLVGSTITDNFHGIGIGKSFAVILKNNKIKNNWYNGVGISGCIFCKVSFNEIAENHIGLYLHESLLTLPYANRIHSNGDCNYFISPLFIPWSFQIS